MQLPIPIFLYGVLHCRNQGLLRMILTRLLDIVGIVMIVGDGLAMFILDEPVKLFSRSLFVQIKLRTGQLLERLSNLVLDNDALERLLHKTCR